LTGHPIFQTNRQFGCYLASQEEFDTGPIINAVWQAKKNCYLPVIADGPEKNLQFLQYQSHDILYPNRYHILEPRATPMILVRQLDVVLVPLVGFDREGNRLGMGSGFYDRTFSFLRDNKTASPCLIGVAYQVQQVENILPDEWDVPLMGILTEKELFFFKK